MTLGIGDAGPLGPPARGPSRAARDGPGSRARGDGGSSSRPTIAEREALAVLASVDGVGPTTLGRLLHNVGSACAVLEVAGRQGGGQALIDASRERVDGGRMSASLTAEAATLLSHAASRADDILNAIEAAGLSIMTIHDPDYPRPLRAIDLPPHVLFVAGRRAALEQSAGIAIVGTRRPTESGRRIAARIATAVARTGASVISGLAVGVDGAAHAAVVAEREANVGAGMTAAVLGGGHGRLFPRAHRTLAERIVAMDGAVVSEFAPDTTPTRGTFPRRNRIISGLADATVVVEARVRSGALITAAWALQQGRGCFLVPGRLDDPTSSGCLEFLREAGGEARVVASVDLLLEDLGLAAGVARSSASALGQPLAPLLELGETARRIGELLVNGAATADDLVALTGLPVASVLASLTLLETRGLVVGAYGRYRPAGRLAGAEPARPVPR
jgi:DNA processing protein